MRADKWNDSGVERIFDDYRRSTATQTEENDSTREILEALADQIVSDPDSFSSRVTLAAANYLIEPRPTKLIALLDLEEELGIEG